MTGTDGDLSVLHEEREVPGNDLAAHPDRFMAGVAQETSVHWDLLPVVLVGPAAVVPQTLDGKVEVDVVGVIERFPVIERLQTGEVQPVPLYQVGKLEEEIASLRGVHGPPDTAQLEGLNSSLDRLVDIRFVSLLDLADHLPGGGVGGGEGLARHRVHPLIVDEYLSEVYLVIECVRSDL